MLACSSHGSPSFPEALSWGQVLSGYRARFTDLSQALVCILSPTVRASHSLNVNLDFSAGLMYFCIPGGIVNGAHHWFAIRILGMVDGWQVGG
jgi:hypothetical protein